MYTRPAAIAFATGYTKLFPVHGCGDAFDVKLLLAEDAANHNMWGIGLNGCCGGFSEWAVARVLAQAGVVPLSQPGNFMCHRVTSISREHGTVLIGT